MTTQPLTPDQVKAKWQAEGMTGAEWARINNFKPRQVSTVLNGQSKARYGLGHEIAVKLGIKLDLSSDQKEEAA